VRRPPPRRPWRRCRERRPLAPSCSLRGSATRTRARRSPPRAARARAAEGLAAHGDLGAFRTIQRQPAWRGRSEAAQLRRFLGAGSQRKLRYARLLTEAIEPDLMPRPLEAVLAAV